MTPAAIIQRPCPRCQGTLTYERDRYGPYIQCLRCARIIDLVVQKKPDLDVKPPTPKTPGTPPVRRP